MDIVNKAVRHKTFGQGEICKLEDGVITVRFGATAKKFIFPDAFREHLILSEKQSKRYVDGVLAELDQDKQLKLEQEIREAEKRRILERLPRSEHSQAAFGFLHNDEQRVMEDWEVFAGNYRSGYRRGRPYVLSRIYPNSACLLTRRGEQDPEEHRRIWGAFMAKENFVGPECADGKIPAHDKYRIILAPQEREKFLFWKYFAPQPGGQQAKWGSMEFKYFSNMTMARILRDILIARRGADQRLGEFLDYFCALNKIDARRLPGRFPAGHKDN